MSEHVELYAALAEAQAELKNPEKTKKAEAGKFSYKYADIADVLNEVRPVLTKHGLTITQPTEMENGNLRVRTVISHKSGQSVESVYPVCSINNDHQAMGSAMTYARRYALCSLIGIAAEEDLDGKGAAKAGERSDVDKMSVHQAKKEVDWSKVEDDIRACKTLDALEKRVATVNARQGMWPDSYVTAALELIEKRRTELVNDNFAGQNKPASIGSALPDFENYDAAIVDLEDRLKAADAEAQAEIWEAEIAPRIEDGQIFPPDVSRLRATLKQAA